MFNEPRCLVKTTVRCNKRGILTWQNCSSFKRPQRADKKDRAVLCTSDRILTLYKQATGKDQQRITKPVKQWFAKEAENHGWSGGHFYQKFNLAMALGVFYLYRQIMLMSL